MPPPEHVNVPDASGTQLSPRSQQGAAGSQNAPGGQPPPTTQDVRPVGSVAHERPGQQGAKMQSAPTSPHVPSGWQVAPPNGSDKHVLPAQHPGSPGPHAENDGEHIPASSTQNESMPIGVQTPPGQHGCVASQTSDRSRQSAGAHVPPRGPPLQRRPAQQSVAEKHPAPDVPHVTSVHTPGPNGVMLHVRPAQHAVPAHDAPTPAHGSPHLAGSPGLHTSGAQHEAAGPQPEPRPPHIRPASVPASAGTPPSRGTAPSAPPPSLPTPPSPVGTAPSRDTPPSAPLASERAASSPDPASLAPGL